VEHAVVTADDRDNAPAGKLEERVLVQVAR